MKFLCVLLFFSSLSFANEGENPFENETIVFRVTGENSQEVFSAVFSTEAEASRMVLLDDEQVLRVSSAPVNPDPRKIRRIMEFGKVGKPSLPMAYQLELFRYSDGEMVLEDKIANIREREYGRTTLSLTNGMTLEVSHVPSVERIAHGAEIKAMGDQFTPLYQFVTEAVAPYIGLGKELDRKLIKGVSEEVHSSKLVPRRSGMFSEMIRVMKEPQGEMAMSFPRSEMFNHSLERFIDNLKKPETFLGFAAFVSAAQKDAVNQLIEKRPELKSWLEREIEKLPLEKREEYRKIFGLKAKK